jgi:hypothetical protein
MLVWSNHHHHTTKHYTPPRYTTPNHTSFHLIYLAGIRVQTLDQDLIDLIDSIAQRPNTFTIIYADHGNTYTDYQVSMLEGRLEMYHPIMLGILSKELGRKFGKDIVENLRTNQYRLLHLFDIRESLVELANYDTKRRLAKKSVLKT